MRSCCPRLVIPTSRPPGASGLRGGLTLLEVTVGTLLVSVLLATSVQVMTRFSRQQRVTQQRALALAALDNVLEQVTYASWDRGTVDQPIERELPPAVARQLGGGRVELRATDVTEPLAARRVTASLAWGPRHATATVPPLQLTTWLFPPHTADTNPSPP